MRNLKKIVIFAAILFFSVSLFASFDPIVAVNPAFRYNSEPRTSLNSDKDWFASPIGYYKTVQDYLYEANDIPSLFSLGFDWTTKYVRFVSFLDIREDYLSIMTNQGYSNIPYIGNSLSAIMDMNFPRLAFVEGGYGGFYASIGRRQIKWGPGLYDMAINNSAPFLDNVFISYSDYGWTYNFIYAGFSNVALNPNEAKTDFNKNLFAHRIMWANDFIRVGLGELNMVYNTFPSILDFTPLGIWHNLYQDEHSNVMMHLSLEGKIQNFRLYGVFALDDLDLPGEPANNMKPAGMGFTLGLDWHVLDGEEYVDPNVKTSDYLLSEDTFKRDDGLNIGIDFNYTTNYMYNRRTFVDEKTFPNGESKPWWGHDEIGKFTVPTRYHSFSGYKSDADAYFLGFPYGPGVFLGTLYANYEAASYFISSSIEYMIRGTARIEDSYFEIENLMDTWFLLKAPFNHVIRINIDGGYTFQKYNIALTGGLLLDFDITNKKTNVNTKIGFAWSL